MGTAARIRRSAASIPAAITAAVSFWRTAIFAATSSVSGPTCSVRIWITRSTSGPHSMAVTIAASTPALADSDLVHSLEHQLSIELPTLIEATLLNAQNELRTGVNSTLEMALRDFLARRQQLR